MKLLLSIFLLMCFTLVGYSQKKAKQDTTVYSAVEVNPQFPGGEEAFGKYLRDNLRFKTGENIDENGNVTGRFFVQFIVEKDGTITHFFELRGSAKSNQVVMKLIKNMPRWSPRKLNGKVVRTKLVVPVHIDFSE